MTSCTMRREIVVLQLRQQAPLVVDAVAQVVLEPQVKALHAAMMKV